ncbi:malonate decarboxylase holo-[acyl-carrier-protein] synthase [Duganella sp. BuS-21]|uniref:malonate decarboxylase holo-[acyl-carrier-protein] synthase n=1 Tax=Duganella sp. BuS-21 TaxID=2943848 RepID=UPI0035A61A9A
MLVWLNQAGWRAAVAAQPQHEAALLQWAAQDWPAVVRRMDANVDADVVCLGLPLPPDANGRKVRLALSARLDDVAKVSRAVVLRSTVRSSGAWRGRLSALCDEAEASDLRVFGSLAMQALTGLQYVSPTSDVDLLFQPVCRRQLDDGVALLARHAQHLPLDGEIVFPGGGAVSWKEWRLAMTHPAKVLVKEMHTVRLADTASLLATLAPQPMLEML